MQSTSLHLQASHGKAMHAFAGSPGGEIPSGAVLGTIRKDHRVSFDALVQARVSLGNTSARLVAKRIAKEPEASQVEALPLDRIHLDPANVREARCFEMATEAHFNAAEMRALRKNLLGSWGHVAHLQAMERQNEPERAKAAAQPRPA